MALVIESVHLQHTLKIFFLFQQSINRMACNLLLILSCIFNDCCSKREGFGIFYENSANMLT